jgi:hypothetical protein
MTPHEIDIAIRKKVLTQTKQYEQASADMLRLTLNVYEARLKLLLSTEEWIQYVLSELTFVRKYLSHPHTIQLSVFIDHCTEQDIADLETRTAEQINAAIDNYSRLELKLTDKQIAQSTGQTVTNNPLNSDVAAREFDDSITVLKCRQRYFSFLKEQYYKLTDQSQDPDETLESADSFFISPITWTNTNNNDFVRFIYGLYHAGFINNGEGEITKTVEQTAALFNVKLGKNWQSNFTKSKHDRNADYDHGSFFDKIKTAFLTYLQQATEKRNKRR